MLPKRLWVLLNWITTFSLHSRAAIAGTAFRSGLLIINRLGRSGKEVVQTLVLRHSRGNSSSLTNRGRTSKDVILLNGAIVLPQLFEAAWNVEGPAAPLNLTFTLSIYSFVITLKRKESLVAEKLILYFLTSHKSSLPTDRFFRPFLFLWRYRDNLLQCREQNAIERLLGTLVLTKLAGNSRVLHSLRIWPLRESIMGCSRERRALKRELVSWFVCWGIINVWWCIHLLCHLRTKREIAWVYNNHIILLLHCITNFEGWWS